jgi:Cu+-exporting ATPase
MTYAAIATDADSAAPGDAADIVLDLDGLHCASCVARVERALTATPGVRAARVNLAAGQAHVTYAPQRTDPQALARAVAAAGYAASPARTADDRADRQAAEIAGTRRRMLWAAVFVLPVFALEMGGHAIPALHHALTGLVGVTGWRLIQMLPITAALAGPGRGFFARGVPGLLRGRPDMDALVALGTGAAWSYSTMATLVPGLFPAGTAQVYFEAAGMIVLLVLVGRWLEARARGRAGAAIARLARLQPDTAPVIRDGEPVDLPLAEIAVGDTILVRPGARIPVDGSVVAGESHVDEAMITGEPVPVAKGPGAALIAGTVNAAGALTMRAERIGADTVLARIVATVERAQAAKLPVEAVVDRVTARFVPVVIAIAALAVLAWLIFGPDPALGMALVAGVSVLIVACPCAMGLATPISVTVGMGRAAELGILFRKGDALQRLGQVRMLAFDKTGTLTEGRPAVTDLSAVEGWTETALLRLAAAAEAASEHPLARAVTDAAAARKMALPKAEEFRAVAGQGVIATVDGRRVALGNAALMAAEGADTAARDAMATDLARNARSPVFVAVDRQLAGVMGLADPLRASARPALKRLHELGIETAMITGDRAEVAEAIAREAGIDHVAAQRDPEGKLAEIARLKGDGPVGFAGDGINDAPALAAADTGIAIGTGTDVAIEAADVVLMSDDLEGVARAVALSRATMRNVRQNLFWAFAYNTALIPVAAGALYPLTGTLLNPALAAMAMALSSVFVVTNALRLRRAGAAPG